jgi:ABC-type microcin C transport system permease subunit YejE
VAVKAPKTDPKNRKGRDQAIRISIFLTILIMIAASVVLFCKSATQTFFAGNRHFILQHVEVKSSGWWEK